MENQHENLENNQKIQIIKEKKTNWSSIFVATILAFTVGIVATYFALQNNQNALTRKIGDDSFDEFLTVFQELQTNHYFFDEENDLIRGAINGMIAATGDNYSNFFTASDFNQAMGHLRESFYGIGAEVAVINGNATIVSPMLGSPAENAGVLPGDVILSVDSVDVRDENLNEVIDRIRGPYGTEVTLGILRSGVDMIEITITRGRIINETVTTDVFVRNGQTIGYIRVSTFGEATLSAFQDAIDELEAMNIDGLIVDLRNNSGGYLHIVNGMVSYVLPSGLPITSAVDRHGNLTTHYTRGNSDSRLDVEIITLINGGSASASEIFAAAMRESGGFEVMGTTSFGKGTVQQPRPISADSVLQLTIQAWLTPHGHLIQDYGVEPTITVEPGELINILQVHLGDEEVLRYDMVHNGVLNAQRTLAALGFNLDRTDGYFDESTVLAVRAFQAEHDLLETGEIDGLTATAISMALRQLIRNPDYDQQIQAAIDWFTN